MWKAILLSAVIFGASHLVHILFGRELPRAILLALNATTGGIFYAAVVLKWRSIWPAVALHSGQNALASIVAVNTPGYSEQPEHLLITFAFQIPLLIIAVFIITRIEPRSAAARLA